jgi:hypothetical protein
LAEEFPMTYHPKDERSATSWMIHQDSAFRVKVVNHRTTLHHIPQ